jgi:hypothetical protein
VRACAVKTLDEANAFLTAAKSSTEVVPFLDGLIAAAAKRLEPTGIKLGLTGFYVPTPPPAAKKPDTSNPHAYPSLKSRVDAGADPVALREEVAVARRDGHITLEQRIELDALLLAKINAQTPPPAPQPCAADELPQVDSPF